MPTEIERHLQMFGLAPNASFAEVKEARRWYTKAFHPDRFTAGSQDAIKAVQKQKELNLAFDELRKWFERGPIAKNGLQQKAPAQTTAWGAEHDTSWLTELLDYRAGLQESGKSYATIKNVYSDLRSFETWLLETFEDIRDLNALPVENIVTEYAVALSDWDYSPATVARHLYSIRGFLDYTNVDSRFIVSLAYQYKSALRPKMKHLTQKQLARFLKVLSKDAFEEEEALIHFILNTGVSVSELCALRWKDLSFMDIPGRRRCIMMRIAGRTGNRTVPLNDAAVGVLAALGLEEVAQKKSRFLERKIFSRAATATEMTPKKVHYLIDRYAKIARMNVTPSILRNTFCRKLADSGVPRQHLAKLIGITEQSAKVYYRDPAPDINELLAAVDNA